MDGAGALRGPGHVGPRPAARALAVRRHATGARAELPSTSVHALVQSRDRYLWLGTSTGPRALRRRAVRGRSTRRNTPGFGDGGVTALAEGPDGALYFGTTSGGDALPRRRRSRRCRHPTGRGRRLVAARRPRRQLLDRRCTAVRCIRWQAGEAMASHQGARARPAPLRHGRGRQRRGLDRHAARRPRASRRRRVRPLGRHRRHHPGAGLRSRGRALDRHAARPAARCRDGAVDAVHAGEGLSHDERLGDPRRPRRQPLGRHGGRRPQPPPRRALQRASPRRRASPTTTCAACSRTTRATSGWAPRTG